MFSVRVGLELELELELENSGAGLVASRNIDAIPSAGVPRSSQALASQVPAATHCAYSCHPPCSCRGRHIGDH